MEIVGSLVSGHLEFNHTITKEVMFCIKEMHQEELNTPTKGPKSSNYQNIEKSASTSREREREENCQHESSISNCCAHFRTDFHQRSSAGRTAPFS